MAKRKKKHVPVRCECGQTAVWDDGWYRCGRWDEDREENVDGCGRVYLEHEAPPPDDGRIREPADVAVRCRAAVARAAVDERLSELDRAVLGLYCETADEHTSVEIMAADGWAADEVSTRLGREVPRQHVWRSRRRLGELGYVRRLGVRDVTRYSLKAAVAGRAAAGKRPATLVEVLKPPAFPTCAQCGGDIPDIHRVSKKYCSPGCRQAAGRAPLRYINEPPLPATAS